MPDIPEPFDDELHIFLRGRQGKLDIDDIFAKSLAQVLREFERHAPDDIVPDGPALPSLLDSGYSFVDVPCGILLLAPDGGIAGGYLSCDLVLDEPHRGKGLGAEIVIERCLRDGENPVLNLDAAAYSRAGLGAHQAAWRHARGNPGETIFRRQRWQRS